MQKGGAKASPSSCPGKVFLAIFPDVYYTIQAQCRCDEMVDVADSKSSLPNPAAFGISIVVQALF